jgi:hypothetical protein
MAIQNFDLEAWKGLGGRILDQLKALLGDRWKQFEEKEQDLIKRIAGDAAYVVMSGLAGAEGVETERLQIDAQLASLQSAGVQLAHHLFWQAVRVAVQAGLGAAGVLIAVA